MGRQSTLIFWALARNSLLVFPLATLVSSFSMTAFLLGFGLAGYSEIAADIGVVQGATLALFYAFSANARNLILSDATGSVAVRLLQTRIVLILPLAAAAYLLSVKVGAVNTSLAVVLILRRASEWIGEIGLARHEYRRRTTHAAQTLLIECTAFSICLISMVLKWNLVASAIPWALAPLVAVRGAQLSWKSERTHIALRSLLPHFGSTAIIGTSVYVFRISVSLLAGKVVAGDLFTAFAIGGTIPTIYGQALAPTLAHRFGAARLPGWLLTIPAFMLLVATGVTALAIKNPAWLAALGRSQIFWLAVGLSIAGGAAMSIAATLRTRLVQQPDGQEVFGPDLLSNILIAISVPFLFHVLGPSSLAGLYALSGCLSLTFLARVGRRGSSTTGSHSIPVLCGIAFLLLAPIFFRINGGLFRDTAFTYNAGGNILNLPVPVSVLGLFAGIALLGNYAVAVRASAILFFTALLISTTSLSIAQGNAAYGSAKLILLAQFLLPMFGLLLGQMYGASTKEPIFESVAMWVLLLVLPAQLMSTWLQGYTQLIPEVFFFSIYQHLQYFPMIVVALMMMVSQALWTAGNKSWVALAFLMPIAMIYAVASLSAGAVIGSLLCLGCFTITQLREVKSRGRAVSTLALSIVCTVAYLTLSESGLLSKLLRTAEGARTTVLWQDKLPVQSGHPKFELLLIGSPVEHWRFYGSGIFDSPKAFFLGHPTPPDRIQHTSAYNYWLDALYNFGAASMLPLAILLFTTISGIWKQRAALLSRPILFGTAMAAIYLLLGENMFTVGMRQPYSGIVTFFIWGLLMTRLHELSRSKEDVVLTK